MKCLLSRIAVFIILINLTLPSSLIAHQTYYIDPAYSGKMDGSITFPYNSWDSITWNDGDVYLQKAGTNFMTKSGLHINNKKNIVIGTYGKGSKPKITATGIESIKIINIFNSQNIVVTGYEISSLSGQAIAGIIISGTYSENNLISDCGLSNLQWGIRILTNSSGNRILNCIISNTQDDGIYIKDVKDIEIGYCKIYNVNLKYLINTDNDFATGDNIQIASSNNLFFDIHHNHLDHSYTGNKFCLIVWGINYTGKLEYNTLIGNSNQISSCIYLSPTTEHVTISYNIFTNGNFGMFSMAKGANVFYNAFINNHIGISVQDNCSMIIQNNTFYNNSKLAITSRKNTTITSQNNLFVQENNSMVYETNGILISDYNFFSGPADIQINSTNSLSSWQNNNKTDYNSLSGDPRFVNPSRLDLSLMKDSPCIDKGINVGLKQDFFGTKLSEDSKIDIGYHEQIN